MSIENAEHVWHPVTGKKLDAKYEKCRNITEEIYKRINLTVQIKKLETETQSDVSDHSDELDSNELSNETDLFACDNTSIPSSTDADIAGPMLRCDKFININNNEETNPKKGVTVYKRPRKRFRKRIKKRPNRTACSDSDLSSDEVPLNRTSDLRTCQREDVDCSNGSLESIMGVPKVVITKDLKLDSSQTKAVGPIESNNTAKSQQTKSKNSKQSARNEETGIAIIKIDMRNAGNPKIVGKDATEKKNCSICSLSFKGERGLRRHMTMSHIILPAQKDATKQEVRSA